MLLKTSLASHRRDWEELASVDPKWSVLTHSDKRNSWDDKEFFATGEDEIAALLQSLKALGYPKTFRNTLDFGCGVGRLTRALTRYFENTWGVDISPKMIENAKANAPRASFALCDADRLPFAQGSFDLVYTARVLQHLPRPSLIANYIREFLRILKVNGVAVFHVPTYVEVVHRLQPRRRLYRISRACGVPADTLIHVGLTPMRVIAISECGILKIVRDARCHVLHVDSDSHPVRGTIAKTFYVINTEMDAPPYFGP